MCEIVVTPSAQPEVSATDAAFLKMWKLDGREVRNLMVLNDVVGEDHVTETLMHIIHLKHLVDGVQSGTACKGNQKTATNGGLPLFILDVGANVGVFSWHAIRGLLPPVSRWAGSQKIGTTDLRGDLFHSAYSLDVHMVEPVDSNRKIIQNWSESLVHDFNLGPTVRSTSPPRPQHASSQRGA